MALDNWCTWAIPMLETYHWHVGNFFPILVDSNQIDKALTVSSASTADSNLTNAWDLILSIKIPRLILKFPFRFRTLINSSWLKSFVRFRISITLHWFLFFSETGARFLMIFWWSWFSNHVKFHVVQNFLDSQNLFSEFLCCLKTVLISQWKHGHKTITLFHYSRMWWKIIFLSSKVQNSKLDFFANKIKVVNN